MSTERPQPRTRRSWSRRLFIGGVLLLLLVIVLLSSGWLWLFHSDAGRQFALNQLQLAMGTVASGEPALRFGSAEGTLSDPLQLRNIDYDLGDGLTLQIDRAVLQMEPSALFGRQLSIRQLSVDGVRLVLGASESGNSDTAAFSWPTLHLPLSLEVHGFSLHDGQLIGVDGKPLLTLAQLDLSAGLARDGQLSIRELTLDSDYGHVDSRGDLLLDGQAEGAAALRWRGADKQPEVRLALKARNGVISIDLSLPQQPAQRLSLRLLDGGGWTLDSHIDQLDLRPWWAEAPIERITAVVSLDGADRSAALSGRLGWDAQNVNVDGSRLRLSKDSGQLQLDPLLIQPETGGSARLQGELALAAGGVHQLQLQLSDLVIPQQADTLPLLVTGEGSLQGQMDAYHLQFDGTLSRGEQQLPVGVEGDGTTEGIALQTLQAGDANGRVNGQLTVDWSPQLAMRFELEMRDFDSGRIDPQLAGRLDGHVNGELSRATDGDWLVDLDIDALRGTLRGLALRGDGELHIGPDAAPSRLALQVGDSRLRISGRAAETLDVNIEMEPLRLQDLLPDYAGTLSGRIGISGTLDSPEAAIDLRGEGLQIDTLTAEQLTVAGHVSLQAQSESQLKLQLRGVANGAAKFTSITADVQGQRESHRIELRADSEPVSLQLDLQGQLADGSWDAMINTLQLKPQGRPTWSLQQPAKLRIDESGIALSRSCLQGETVSVCAEANAGRQQQTAQLQLDKLPLSLLAPWIPAEPGLELAIEGELNGTASVQRLGEQLTGSLRLRSADGRVAYAVSPNQQLVAWTELQLDGGLSADALDLDLRGQLDDNGRIEAALRGGSPLVDMDSPISGQVSVELPQLRALALLDPDLSDPSGALRGELRVQGSWRSPSVGGYLEATDLSGEIPALGLHLTDSRLRLDSDNGTRFQLNGEIDSGDGKLSISGDVDPFAESGGNASLAVKGERVLASDTPLLKVWVSPDVTLEWQSGAGIKLRGSVRIPEGNLNLERVEGSEAPDPDVVVLDPRPGRQVGSGLPIDTSITLELGDKVSLQGFGFDGRVEGTLAIRERPQRSATGRGNLSVSGRYRAYGQDLKIVRGQMLFASSALSNPSLNVRAEREFEQQTVGLDVRGTALLPILEVYSDPPLDQAEALSYLVLGRPLRSATSTEGAQLSQAAAAVGGNLLAAQLGDRLGFDTFEIADSRALGGAAFSVGKYLSPRLYIGYGVSLFGTGQVVTFRYIINRLWQAEIESGTENRVGVNYTLER